MSDFITKLKLIYLHYLIVAIGFTVIYSGIIWLVQYQLALVDMDEDLVRFWLPLGIAIIVVFIWVRPRIKLLILKDKQGNLPFLYFFAACVNLWVPTIILQEYLQTATGKLTTLNSIDNINQNPVTKYYYLKNHFIDKQHIGLYRTTTTSGKNNETLTFHIYVICPILKDSLSLDSGNRPNYRFDKLPKAWLGIDYSKSISNHLGDAEKDTIFKNFNEEISKKFKVQELNHFNYLDHLGNNEKRKGYLKAFESLNYNGTPVVLEARNEPFEDRNGGSLGWVFKSLGIGAVVWLLMIVFPKLDKKQLLKLPEYSLPNQWKVISPLFSITIFTKGNVSITITLIALNILVFVVMVFAGLGFISFHGDDLYNWGANFRPAIEEGQWWRLLTNVFLHGGLMHLLMNMYGLLFAGIFVEPILGKLKYAGAYLLCGLIASLSSAWWHPATISIGASGAIFGMYGTLLALLTTNKVDPLSKKSLFINTGIFIGLNLLFGLTGGIDNAAHIGGLLAGLVLGYIFYFFIEKPKPKRTYKRKSKTLKSDDATVVNSAANDPMTPQA